MTVAVKYSKAMGVLSAKVPSVIRTILYWLTVSSLTADHCGIMESINIRDWKFMLYFSLLSEQADHKVKFQRYSINEVLSNFTYKYGFYLGYSTCRRSLLSNGN